MTYLSPKTIIVDFLRVHLTDPRDRAEDTHSESLTATTCKVNNFEMTPPSGSVSCITSLEVNSTTKNKWKDYYWLERTQTIVFYSDLTNGDTIDITYKYGSTNWIFPGKAQKKLSGSSFPRINILIPASVGRRLGNYEAPVNAAIQFQIDVWCKEKQDGQIFTIDSRAYTGDELGEYLAYKITEAFEDNEEDLFPALQNYTPNGMPRDLPFDEEMQCHHKAVECMMTGLELGRIS